LEIKAVDNKREHGKIDNVSYGLEPDHRCITCSIGVKFSGGGYQSFGNLILDDGLLKSFLADLCATFEVDNVDDMVGKECYVLKCFGYNNDYIEGLESISGKRMTLTSWRKKHFPDTLSPLDVEIKRIGSRITQAQNTINTAIQDLSTVQSRYTDWG